MCFSSPAPAATPEPAAAPAAPAIPASQSATSAAQAAPATETSQIGFARKLENKKRFGKATGPASRRTDAASTGTGADTGSGIRM